MNLVDNLLAKLQAGLFLELVTTDPPIVPEWVPDSEQTKCLFCGQSFTTFNRRHHCRQCGRIFCSRCIILYQDEKKRKICKLCHEIIQMDTKLKSYQAYDLQSVLVPEITAHFRSQDMYYLSEVIRLFQNQMKNDRTKTQFLEYMTHEVLLEIMASLSNQLQISQNITAIFNFLGLFVNLTVQHVPTNTPAEIIFFALRALEFRDQLCIQEVATLLLANLSTSYNYAGECFVQPDLTIRCFTLLKSAAPTVKCHVLCLISNLISYFPEKLSDFLPKQHLSNSIARHCIFTILGSCLKSSMPDEATQALRLCWIFYQRKDMRELMRKHKVDVFAQLIENFSFKIESVISDMQENDLKLLASLYFAINFYAFAINYVQADAKRFGVLLLSKFDLLIKLLTDDQFSAKCAIFLLDMLANELPEEFGKKLSENKDIFKQTINGIIDGNNLTQDISQHLSSILDSQESNAVAVEIRKEWWDGMVLAGR